MSTSNSGLGIEHTNLSSLPKEQLREKLEALNRLNQQALQGEAPRPQGIPPGFAQRPLGGFPTFPMRNPPPGFPPPSHPPMVQPMQAMPNLSMRPPIGHPGVVQRPFIGSAQQLIPPPSNGMVRGVDHSQFYRNPVPPQTAALQQMIKGMQHSIHNFQGAPLIKMLPEMARREVHGEVLTLEQVEGAATRLSLPRDLPLPPPPEPEVESDSENSLEEEIEFEKSMERLRRGFKEPKPMMRYPERIPGVGYLSDIPGILVNEPRELYKPPMNVPRDPDASPVKSTYFPRRILQDGQIERVPLPSISDAKDTILKQNPDDDSGNSDEGDQVTDAMTDLSLNDRQRWPRRKRRGRSNNSVNGGRGQRDSRGDEEEGGARGGRRRDFRPRRPPNGPI